MDNQFLRIKWFHVLLHSTTGILVAVLLWFSGLLIGVEGKTYDLRASLMAKPSPNSDSIVLVVVDQASIDWVADNIGIGWPWPRELFASVITNCIRRGAESVGFDILFTENSTFGVHDDIKLKNAMLQTGNFALGSIFPSNISGNYQKWPDTIPIPKYNNHFAKEALSIFPSYPYATFPVPELITEGIVLANVQHESDNDGIYRKVHPFVIFDQVPLPALGLGVYLAGNPDARLDFESGEFILNNRTVPLDDSGKVLLNFRGPGGTYKRISAASLIRNEFQLLNEEIDKDDIQDDLNGKYVLFGYTAPGLHDLRPSPTDGAYPGVEINATILDNILTDDFIKPVNTFQTILRIVIFTLFATFILSFTSKKTVQVAAAFCMAILPVAIAFLLYRFGYDFKMIPIQISVITGTSISIAHRYFVVGSQEKFIRHSFKHYLSPVVIDQLIHNPDRLKLGGERKELTLFFSDLEGFTRISEGLEPEDLINLLNEYLTAMTDIILEEEGTVDKFEGDAIIAFWNAPLDIDNHAEKAVRTALRCQNKLDELYPYFLEQYGKRLRMRIGINTGFAVAGNMGSSRRFDYSVLGDAVNLAARLEGANKYYGTYTMISSATYEQLGNDFCCRELGKIRVVGRREPVIVYEPLSYEKATEIDPYFSQGLALFYEGKFQNAFDCFNVKAKQDPAARAYCKKCKELIGKEIEKWTGILELDSK